MTFVPPDELSHYMGRKEVAIVDLREREEYEKNHIRGAINIPFEHLMDEFGRLEKYSLVIFYCYRGHSSLKATLQAKQWGIRSASLSGGYERVMQIYGD